MGTAIRPRTYIDKNKINTSDQRELKTFDLFVEERPLHPSIAIPYIYMCVCVWCVCVCDSHLPINLVLLGLICILGTQR